MSDDEQAPTPIEETQVVNLLFLLMSEHGTLIVDHLVFIVYVFLCEFPFPPLTKGLYRGAKSRKFGYLTL